MLRISNWTKGITLLILFLGILFALPNVLPDSVTSKFPFWLPSSAVTLGLDLQGGSYMLLEVDYPAVEREKLDTLRSDIRYKLRKAHIGYVYDQNPGPGAVGLRILDADRYADAKKILDDLNPMSGGSMLALGARQFDITEPSDGHLVMTTTEVYRNTNKSDVVGESIEAVRRRIDELGTREPTITRQGDDRILVQVPGLADPKHLLETLGRTAKMTFQLVDETANPELVARGQVPVGSMLLHESPRDEAARKRHEKGPPIAVQRRVMVSGDHLTSAGAVFNSQSGRPVVTFRFDSVGARQFGDVTKANTGRRFAVVLDDEVITAPNINEPILGGSGEISGNFTMESANELAALLRAGALPAPLKVLDQRTVGPEMGQDAINAGKFSALGGLALVVIFMIARYGLFGVFADVALAFNMVLLMAVLTRFGATLTLPGIAGIVLTMGMAVDANVLIFERIREEVRNGRTIIAAIDTGFQRARATIFDANMTHLIAAAILFELGSGPVRGFAVTLGVGILTSFFTAVMVTRLMVVTWLNAARPKTLTM